MEIKQTPLSINAIINEMQWRLKLHTRASSGPHREMAKKYAEALNKAMGLSLVDHAEIISDYPELVEHTDTHGCAVRTRDGEVLLIATRSAKGLAGKRRKAGMEYVRSILKGEHSETIASYKNPCPLPVHVRHYIERHDINPDAVEVLNTLLQRVEFRHGGAMFKFSTRWERSIKKQIDRDDGKGKPHLIYSPDPKHRETDRIQVTLPGKPRVRLTKHGISIGQGLPEAVRLGLIGKTMDNLVELPGLSGMVINTVSAYSDAITQVRVKMR